ncbi:MAG: Fe-S cluster assembly protein SufD [Paracoccaceae bacterium]|jgi:Fe-S cluster assembly protein SufD
MTAFSQKASELQPTTGLSWLEVFNQRGRERWGVTPFPTRKTENWKYTSLQSLETGAYLHWSQPQQLAEVAKPDAIPSLEDCALVFINGVFSAAHSSQQWPQGLDCCRFSDADESQQQAILAKLGTISDSNNHLFAALNEAWLQEGIYIRVAANTVLKQPIYIHHISTAQEHSFSVNQRVLVHLETSAEASVVEHYSSSTETQNSFGNAVTEVQLDANSRLSHYQLHLQEEHALHISSVHVNLDRDSTFNSFMMSMGSLLQRSDVVVNHLGEGAHCGIQGVYLPHNKHLVDFHTCIEHRVPNCTTHEVFRGIIGDSGKAVFNGRIHIHPQAQKTVADLSNKNLLTSHDAEIDTKPELEIYADDVKCSHGATIARLDEKALYYLQSRGLDRQRAEVMLSYGFINELLEQIPHSVIRDYLTPRVSALFVKKFDRARGAV